jgi:hypothetical protein
LYSKCRTADQLFTALLAELPMPLMIVAVTLSRYAFEISSGHIVYVRRILPPEPNAVAIQTGVLMKSIHKLVFNPLHRAIYKCLIASGRK